MNIGMKSRHQHPQQRLGGDDPHHAGQQRHAILREGRSATHLYLSSAITYFVIACLFVGVGWCSTCHSSPWHYIRTYFRVEEVGVSQIKG